MRVLMAVCAVAILTSTAAYGQSHSTLTLYPIPDRVYAGETVAFTGTLTGGGSPLPGRTVWICEDDPFVPDVCLASGTTDYAGTFNIEWEVEAGIVEIDYDIYAKFDGDSQYYGDQSPRQTMSVYKHGGSIVLDPIPASAALGQAVGLTGTLTLDGHSPEGAIVYIKDEDTLNPDDLLTTAYVDSSGHFTTYWIVDNVDPDDTVDIQAVFEGNALYDRLASPVQGMRTHADPLWPDPSPVGGDGYMKLYHSLDFEQAPRILIVPSHDTYSEVRKHIFPVQEGIMLLTAMLEQEYVDGNWDVDFDVLMPGDNFVDTEPDVIVNLVTRDEESGCNDWWGRADVSNVKPVQTIVCSIDERSREGIGGTALHEFVHAIGVGHTFNIAGDRMCSTEDGVPTCPDLSSKSDIPSTLNLAAIVAVYGADGFQNPNNKIAYNEKFTLADYQSGNHQIQQWDQSPLPTEYSGSYDAFTYTDDTWYYPGESVLIDGFYWGTYDGPSIVTVVDPDGYVADHIRVDVVDRFFGVQADGYYMPGAYVVWVFDGQENFVSSTAFHVVYPQTSSVYEGYAYAAWAEYGPGEEVTVRDYYWEPYYASSSIDILGPDGHLANYLHLDAVSIDFSAAAGRYYEPGIYTVLFYDHLDNLVSSSTFRIVESTDASLYSASIYTDHIFYHPGQTVLIDGFYWGTYDGPSNVVVADSDWYVVDELPVDVEDEFMVETAGHYPPGTYVVWLYDHAGELASSTAFHIVDMD